MKACLYRSLLVGAPLVLMCCAGGPPTAAVKPTDRIGDCPKSPNCVSTQAVAPSRRMAPLPYRRDRPTARRLVLSIVGAMPRATLAVAEERYLQFQFRSALFGFVDDVAFVFDDKAACIHFRSAARTGYWDLGVNRSRMSAISDAYRAADIDPAADPDPEEPRR